MAVGREVASGRPVGPAEMSNGLPGGRSKGLDIRSKGLDVRAIPDRSSPGVAEEMLLVLKFF